MQPRERSLKIVSDVLMVVGGMLLFFGVGVSFFLVGASGSFSTFTTFITTQPLMFAGGYLGPIVAGLALLKIANLMQVDGNLHGSSSRLVSIWILSFVVLILLAISITIFVIDPRG